MKKRRRLKIKNVLVLIVFIILIIVLIISLFSKHNKTLEDIGYNKLEIEELKDISKNELDIIYKYDYNNNLIYIIKSDDYDSNKLELYLKYTLKYNDVDYIKIFDLINNEYFIESNIDKYVEYLKNHDRIDNVITYINENIDLDLDDTTLAFVNEKYFIKDYLDRYLNYYKYNSHLSYKEVITRVNSNLDYRFYSDSKEADLSKGMYTLVNKFYYLTKDYVPDNLVNVTGKYARDSAQITKITYDNFVKMADYMSTLGMTIKITTGYRSYNFQATLYNNYVRIDGINEADTYSARPGYSEHQLGYSIDLTNAKNVSFSEFINTDEYKWLKENAHKYGFILRYPKDKEYLTGYVYETWHLRYVGEEIATYIYENNITYEEYYAYFLR